MIANLTTKYGIRVDNLAGLAFPETLGTNPDERLVHR